MPIEKEEARSILILLSGLFIEILKPCDTDLAVRPALVRD
jgi:hypothetical protein